MTSEYDSICGECEVVLTHSHSEPRLFDLPTSIYEQAVNNCVIRKLNVGKRRYIVLFALATREHSYYSQ